MARFNEQKVVTKKTVNLAGGEAYKESPKLELISLLVTSFVEDKYYRSAEQSLEKVTELEMKVDPLFAAKAAIFARKEFGMRSITHALASAVAADTRAKGEEWTKRFYRAVINRPDDVTEILAYYLAVYGKPIPNALKKGLGKALAGFDGYQLAKYRGERKAVSLVDAVNLLHPPHTEHLRKLVYGELGPAKTWEAGLTQAGQEADSEVEKAGLKKDVWVSLIREHKLPYFALLRNLRNIIEQAPEVLDEALVQLTDRNLIKKSLVLPFRFTTAYKEVEKLGVGKVLAALDDAVEISLSNVPVLPGKTLVALDTSGSMGGRPYEIGKLFAAVLTKTNDADLVVFSSDSRYGSRGNGHKYVAVNPKSTITDIDKSIPYLGGGTDFNLIFSKAKDKYDRIIILSDMQAWVGYNTPKDSFKAYRDKFDAKPVIYSFDLAGYGSLQFPEKNVYALAGFSDKIFDVMALLETDKNAFVKRIEAVKF